MSKKQTITYLDDIMDLDSPYAADADLSKKVERENLDRNAYSGPLKNKMRSHVDHRMAMNSGIPDSIQSYYNINNFEPPAPEYNYGPKLFKPEPRNDYFVSEISCLEISRHVTNCPICSKFYENDKSSYVIFIVILIVIIIILFKKVLERQ